MKKKAFSLAELIVAFIVISLITAAAMPIFFKKTAKINLKGINEISTKCDGLSTNCKLCRNTATSTECIICKATCPLGQYLNRKTCSCHSCSKFNTISPYSSSNQCTNCCTRCDVDFCTGCAKGYGIAASDRSKNMPCKECLEGYYSDTVKDETCKACSRGFFQPERRKTNISDCKRCTPGHKCPNPGMGQEENCGAGYYQPNYEQIKCLKCSSGHKCPGPADTAETDCGIGFYQSQMGQAACNDCLAIKANSTTLGVNSTNASSCVCKPGLELIGGICRVCQKGTYKILAGDVFCTKCLKGQQLNLVGASSNLCKDCDAGTYCPVEGTPDPIDCPAGSYCPQGSIDPVSCPDYSTSVAKSKKIEDCKCIAGYKKSGNRCVPCGYGYYCPGGDSVYKCPDNSSTSTTTSYSISQCSCKSGFYKSGNSCYSCSNLDSNCLTCNSNGTACLSCRNGLAPNGRACGCKARTSCPYPNMHFLKLDSDGCNAICVSYRNAGQTGGYGNLSVAQPHSAEYNHARGGLNIKGGASEASYWVGITSHTNNPSTDSVPYPKCNNLFGYDGCSRVVATWSAADKACKASGMRLPTSTELSYTSAWQNAARSLDLCTHTYDSDSEYHTGGNIPANNKYAPSGLTWCATASRCPHAVSGSCYPSLFWSSSSDTAGGLNDSEMQLYSVDSSDPLSVRCVVDAI